MTSKLHNVILHVTGAYKLKAFTEKYVYIFARNYCLDHYKESVKFILSIIVTMWLLWLQFDDTYRKITLIMG